MGTLRSREIAETYQIRVKSGELKQSCPLCDREALQKFIYWKIIKNNFPYDRIASVHDMIVPLRHIKESGLSAEEKNELSKIKHGYINSTYDFLLESTTKVRSIPAHFHIHLVVINEQE